MAQHVEARSLSEVNYLAANPPRFPENPTKKYGELTLYISRVPGTRDLILSPFKPHLKNVTEEDIRSSLYYIHLNLPSDEHLARPPPSSQENSPPRASLEKAASPILRKPLPASARIHQVPTPPATDTLRVSDPGCALSQSQLSHDGVITPSITHGDRPSELTDSNRGGDNGRKLGSDDPADRPALPPRPYSYFPRPQSPSHNQGEEGLQGQTRSPISIARKPVGPRPLDTPPPRVPDKRPARPVSVGGADGLGTHRLPIHGYVPHSQQLLPPGHSPASPRSPVLSERQLNVVPTMTASPTPNQLRPSRPRSPPKQAPLEPQQALPSAGSIPFTLTIIRRDRTSGNQWNVGKLSSYFQSAVMPTTSLHTEYSGSTQMISPPQSPRKSAEMGGGRTTAPVINILLENSGYSQYIARNRTSLDIQRISLDAQQKNAGSSAASVPHRGGLRSDSTDWIPLGGPQLQVSPSGTGGGGSDEFFTRKLVMRYSKTTTSKVRDAFRKRSSSSPATTSEDSNRNDINTDGDGYPLTVEPPRRPYFHSRQGSTVSIGSAGSHFEAGSTSPPSSPLTKSNLLQQHHSNHHLTAQSGSCLTPGPGLRRSGYVFISPWDRLCYFQTVGGRTVECWHSPPVPQKSSGPFHGDDNDGGDYPDGRPHLKPIMASKLKFNLPSRDLFHSSKDKAHHRHHSHGSSLGDISHDDSDDSDHDGSGFGLHRLALGRENAGGGNRGKRAKLGKLVIKEEGMKMLDLVVAANMGVWWDVWGKNIEGYKSLGWG